MTLEICFKFVVKFVQYFAPVEYKTVTFVKMLVTIVVSYSLYFNQFSVFISITAIGQGNKSIHQGAVFRQQPINSPGGK